MGYGLNILNSSGEIQIDSIYQNYITVETGSFSCPNTRGFNSVSFSTAISSSYTPIIAFTVPIYHYMSLYSLNYSEGNFTGFTYGHTPGTSETVYYAVYVEANKITPPSSAYGINIFNAGGELVFTSDSGEYFNILTVDTYDYSAVAPNKPSPRNVTVSDADNNYFAFYPWLASRFLVGEPPPVVYYSYGIGMYYINSTTVRLDSYYYATSVSGAGPGYPGSGTLIEVKRV